LDVPYRGGKNGKGGPRAKHRPKPGNPPTGSQKPTRRRKKVQVRRMFWDIRTGKRTGEMGHDHNSTRPRERLGPVYTGEKGRGRGNATAFFSRRSSSERRHMRRERKKSM